MKNRHPALASDLMEEWRAVLIDAMTLALVHHHEIKQEHFAPAEDEDPPGIFLTREGRAIFLRAYEKKMRAASRYGCGDGKRLLSEHPRASGTAVCTGTHGGERRHLRARAAAMR